MEWQYICLDPDGKKVTDRPTSQALVESIIPTFLAEGRWHDTRWPVGIELVLADWRWSNRWKRFTIHDTGGGTHILKQVNE